ncbi:MAG: cupin domain-containing protein [Salaquimonas sp.]
MSKVVHFSSPPLETSHRRLADLPERVVEGDPMHETHTQFESPDGKLIAGTWTSTPGKWHAFIDRDEFCSILDGRGELISEAGDIVAFYKGDSFMIPDGFRGFWHIIETTTKHFVIRLK